MNKLEFVLIAVMERGNPGSTMPTHSGLVCMTDLQRAISERVCSVTKYERLIAIDNSGRKVEISGNTAASRRDHGIIFNPGERAIFQTWHREGKVSQS